MINEYATLSDITWYLKDLNNEQRARIERLITTGLFHVFGPVEKSNVSYNTRQELIEFLRKL